MARECVSAIWRESVLQRHDESVLQRGDRVFGRRWGDSADRDESSRGRHDMLCSPRVRCAGVRAGEERGERREGRPSGIR